MRGLFNIYRVVAFVVGVLLIVLTTAFIVKLLTEQGSPAYRHADSVVAAVGFAHGMLYIVYVLLAFFLAAKARLSLPFTFLMLAAGLIPVLIFWVERQVSRRLHEDHPEVFGTVEPLR